MRKPNGFEWFSTNCMMLTGLLLLGLGLIWTSLGCYPDGIGGCMIYKVVNVTVSYSRVVSNWDKACTTRYQGLSPCYDVYIYLTNNDNGRDCIYYQKYDYEDFPHVNATQQIYEVGSRKTMKRSPFGDCSVIGRDWRFGWLLGITIIITGISLFVISGIVKVIS